MHDTNEEIHLFILEEDQRKNSERAVYEKTISEWIQKPLPHLETGSKATEEVDFVELRPRDQHFRVGLGVSITIVACSFISLIALSRLDAIVHKDLYAYGLQFSLDWAVPYWSAIRWTMGVLSTIVATGMIFGIYALRCRSRERRADKRLIYGLSDGSIIRVKTVVNSVKKLKEYDKNGKPVYSIEAGNIVEVLEPPK